MVDGGKMSKSLGNLHTLEDLAARGYSAAEVRYVLMSGHYSAPLNFTFHTLDSARQALQKLAKHETSLRVKAGLPEGSVLSYDELAASGDCGPFTDAWALLLKDLNVPGAMGALFGAIKEADQTATDAAAAAKAWRGLHFILSALGLVLPPPEKPAQAPAEVVALAEERWNAKQSKDWPAADRCRDALAALGWTTKDSKTGYELQKI
jgi:cysteinyl-tRNA synthetase